MGTDMGTEFLSSQHNLFSRKRHKLRFQRRLDSPSARLDLAAGAAQESRLRACVKLSNNDQNIIFATGYHAALRRPTST